METNLIPSQNTKASAQASQWDALIDFDTSKGAEETSDNEREKCSVQILTQELFNGFMNSLPQDANPVEYANSPEGYSEFFSYMADELDQKYADVGQEDQSKLYELYYGIVYEYSEDYMNRGGKIPAEFDDFVFFGDDSEDENDTVLKVQEKYRDTIDRMKDNRLEQMPGEFDSLTKSLQSQIQEWNNSYREPFGGQREAPDYSELFSKLALLSRVSDMSGGKLGMAPIVKMVRDRIVPEILPQFNGNQDTMFSFEVLANFAERAPDILENVDSPAVGVARLAAKRKLEREKDLDYNTFYRADALEEMLRDYIYKKEGNNPLKKDGSFSEAFQDDTFYNLCRLEMMNKSKCRAIAEVIGSERYAAIEFAAGLELGDKSRSPVMPILAEAIMKSDNPERLKDSCLKICDVDSGGTKNYRDVLLALHKLSSGQTDSEYYALKYAREATWQLRDLIESIESDKNALKKMDRICGIADGVLGYRFDEKMISDYFRDCVESGREFSDEEAMFLKVAGQIDPKERPYIHEVLRGKLGHDMYQGGVLQHNIAGLIGACVGLKENAGLDKVMKFLLDDENFTEKKISHDSAEGIRDMVLQVYASNSLKLRRVAEPVVRSVLEATKKTTVNDGIDYNISVAQEKLSTIEGVFLRDELPMLAKNFLVFETIHPIESFNGSFISGREEKVSPTLVKASERDPQVAYALILRDLVRNGVESNSLELRQYLEGLQSGQAIMDRIGSGEADYDSLSSDEQAKVRRFVNQLVAGHNQTKAGREEVVAMTARGGVRGEEDVPEGANWLYHDMPINSDTIKRINAAFGVTRRHNASDRLVRQFAYFNGYTGVGDMLAKMDEIRDTAHARNVEAARQPFVVRAGDIVKNVNGKYLDSLLGDGTNCKEFLGASADSDQTPLDSDFTFVSKDASIADCYEIYMNPNGNFGHVWYVSHVTPDRYRVTRKNGEQPESIEEEPNINDTRMELFRTLHDTHYGVRTGIGSTNIDALVIDENEYLDRTAFRVVKNGFYIPIYDKETGALLFTPEDYEKMRTNLSGNHEYRTGKYHRASEADWAADVGYTSDIEIDVGANNQEVARKNSAILSSFASKLAGTGLQFRDHIDSDLTSGFIEVSSTGSTGRGTNVPGDGDFDFIFRVDRGIFEDKGRLRELSERLTEGIKFDQKSESRSTGNPWDIRTKHVHVEGLDDEVDIDVTFVQRTDTVTYATEDCIVDYLSNFSKEERAQVVKNIIAAKKMFKENKCYKPKHAGGRDEETGESLAQGGLGGVGVENWILQNGGSLTAAARSFLDAAGVYDNPEARPKPFKEFAKVYQLWDLGSNHKAEDTGKYPHDNFIENNLDAGGYERMINALLTAGFGTR